MAHVIGMLVLLVALTGCQPRIRVVDVSESSLVAASPVVRRAPTGDTGYLHIAWTEQSSSLQDEDTRVWFRRVHVLGAPKEPRIELGSATGAALQPLHMAVTLHNTHIVNMGFPPRGSAYDVFLSTSNDAGVSFRPALNLSSSNTPSLHPRVAARDDTVFVTWLEKVSTNGPHEVRVRESTTGGRTFGSFVTLTTRAAEMTPEVVVSDRQAFVIYCEPGGTTFIRRRDLTAGAAWQTPEQLSEGAAQCGFESLSTHGPVYAAWLEQDPSTQLPTLVVKRSADGGAFANVGRRWVREVNPVQTIYASALGARVYVLFDGLLEPSSANRALYSTWNTDDGTLQQPWNLNGPFTHRPKDLAVSTGGSAIGVVWSRDGVDDLTFVRPDYQRRTPAEVPPTLTDREGAVMRGITPDVQAHGKDYYVVWRNSSRRIMLYSFREWRLSE